MRTRRRIIIAAVAVVAMAGLVTGLLLALGGGPAKPAPAVPASEQLRSPFTGEPVPSLNRVLAVKIDNIVNARPQTGLTHADIVYVLPVEGGLSRRRCPTRRPRSASPGRRPAGGGWCPWTESGR